MKEIDQQLFEAIERKDDVAVIQGLLERGANPNSLNSQQKTPLMLACEFGCLSVVKHLLRYNKTVNSINDGEPNFKTALNYAMSSNQNNSHAEIIEAFFECDDLCDEDNNLLLVYFSGTSKLDKIKSCLDDRGCDINYSDRNHGSAVHNAVEHNQAIILNELIKRNVDTNKLNFLAETPLIVAIRKGHIESFSILAVQKNLLLHHQSYLLSTPLTAATYFGQNTMAGELLKKEKEGEFLDSLHPGTLLCAVRQNNEYLVKAFINAGANINTNGKEGYKEPPDWVWKERQPSPFAYSGLPVFELPTIVALREGKNKTLPVLLAHNLDLDKVGTCNKSAKFLIESEDSGIAPEVRQLAVSILRTENPEASSTVATKSNFFQAVTPTSTVAPLATAQAFSESQLTGYLRTVCSMPEEMRLDEFEKIRQAFAEAGLNITIEPMLNSSLIARNP